MTEEAYSLQRKKQALKYIAYVICSALLAYLLTEISVATQTFPPFNSSFFWIYVVIYYASTIVAIGSIGLGAWAFIALTNMATTDSEILRKDREATNIEH